MYEYSMKGVVETMPYLHVKTSIAVNDPMKEALRNELAGIMDILPGKTRDNTMIQIEDGATLTMGDSKDPCAFVDLRLFKPSPDEAKARFVRAAGEILKEQLGIELRRIYMNVIELPSWGANGEYSL